MERQKFEEKWKDAFRDAEVTPSDNVWTNIELDLEKSERDSVSHKLFFYKMVAAASVVFALMVGAGGLYFYSNYQHQIAFNINNTTPVNPRSSETDTDQIKTNSADIESNDTKGTAELNNDGEIFKSEEGDVNDDLAANRNAIDTSSDRNLLRKRTSPKRYSIKSESGDRNAVASSTIIDESTMVEPSGVNGEGFHTSENGVIENNTSLLATQTTIEQGMLPALTTIPESALNVEQIKIDSEKAKQTNEIDPVVLMLAKMDQREKELKKGEEEKKDKQNSSDEKLWTSVGFAAGSFNAKGSGLSPGSTPSTTFSGNIANGATNEAKASGIAYSIGVNMGKRFADKWVVQGGVNYLTQLSDYTAQTAIGNMDFQSFRPESINELNKLNEGDVASGDTKVITTAPYNVNNSVRYISLPLQAGYMLVDKKFGVQLNAGISTDLFLQNTKKAEGQNISAINQNLTDDDNPYRTTNFSGLFGTELTYKLGSRYRVALNPGVRYPFSSIYKSSVGVQSAPLTFDVGMRFRYIFQ